MARFFPAGGGGGPCDVEAIGNYLVGPNKDGARGNYAIDIQTKRGNPAYGAGGDYSICIGQDSSCYTGSSNIAIGRGARAYGHPPPYELYSSLAIGYNARTSGDEGISIGHGATSGGVGCVSIGRGAYTSQYRSISIGYNASTQWNGTICIGDAAYAGYGAEHAVVIGAGAEIGGYNCHHNIVIGWTAYTNKRGAICIGGAASVTGVNGFALGEYSSAVTGVALGGAASAQNGIAIGNGAVEYAGGIAIGGSVQYGGIGIGCSALGNSVCIGSGFASAYTGVVAIGAAVFATQYDCVAIGHGAIAGIYPYGPYRGSVAIGNYARTGYNYSIAIGNHASAPKANVIAIGNYASADGVTYIAHIGDAAINARMEVDGTWSMMDWKVRRDPTPEIKTCTHTLTIDLNGDEFKVLLYQSGPM